MTIQSANYLRMHEHQTQSPTGKIPPPPVPSIKINLLNSLYFFIGFFLLLQIIGKNIYKLRLKRFVQFAAFPSLFAIHVNIVEMLRSKCSK